jgi:hypothetical protein
MEASVKSMFGMCFNWKVLAGLGAVAAGVLAFSPATGLALLPFLLLAACPLSMVGMMFAMREMHSDTKDADPVKNQSPEELQERLAQLAEAQRRVEAQLAAEPREAASVTATISRETPAEANR